MLGGGGLSFVSTLGMCSGYYQLGMDAESSAKDHCLRVSCIITEG